MSSRKREKPYPSRHASYSSRPKRRRPLPLDAVAGEAEIGGSSASSSASKAPTSVMVIGLPAECSVLDLKSRFEIYGTISRTRVESSGVAYINFRSNDAAQSAVDAARDSSFPVTLHSVPVQVMWASDPITQWKRGDGLSSKLIRAEVPLSRRRNKLGSAIVNPRAENNSTRSTTGDNMLNLEGPFKGREIVAYDDIL